MAELVGFAGNCGMRILYALDPQPSTMIQRVNTLLLRDSRCGIIAFTDAVNRRYGSNFAAYIKEHKLGKLSTSGRVRNPNSGRMIQAWYWMPNRDTINQIAQGGVNANLRV